MNEIYVKTNELNSWTAKYFDKDLISIDDLITVIEDLDSEIENWKEKYDDLLQDLKDNYQPISKSKQYEISDDDFI